MDGRRLFTNEYLSARTPEEILLLQRHFEMEKTKNVRALIELDEWMEGLIFKAHGKLVFRKIPDELPPLPGTLFTKPAAPAVNSPAKPDNQRDTASPGQHGMFAEKPAAKKERKSVLEEFFEEQENSYCPIM